jgi:hypothetical protein
MVSQLNQFYMSDVGVYYETMFVVLTSIITSLLSMGGFELFKYFLKVLNL